jgi:predicted lysophospholipase L1 biosynthesis ABC-type transport system permease subunit
VKNLLQDLRLALRQMRRSPGFAFTAVLTLALGIAANIIVLGVLQALVLRSLDVPHPDRLKQLQPTTLGFPVFAYPEARDVRDESIRVALGAQAQQILSAALGRMLILLAGGSMVGLVLGVAASRLLSAIVYQASAQDPFVLAAVALTMVLTGMLSVAGPVRRAFHIDPAHLLREQ